MNRDEIFAEKMKMNLDAQKFDLYNKTSEQLYCRVLNSYFTDKLVDWEKLSSVIFFHIFLSKCAYVSAINQFARSDSFPRISHEMAAVK